MHFPIILFLLLGARSIRTQTPSAGPVGPITIHEFSNCQPALNKINLDLKLNTEDDESNSVSASFTIDKEYGNELQLVIDLQQWENNMWRNMQRVTGTSVFDFINKHLSKPWEKLRAAAEPKLEEINKIPAGTYKVSNFKEIYDNVDFPQVIYGRLKITIQARVEDDEILCYSAEVETFEP